MEALLKQYPFLKKHVKHEKDVACSGRVIGTGPHGEVEEMLMRGTICAGKKVHQFLTDSVDIPNSKVSEKLAVACNHLSHLSHPNLAAFFGISFLRNMQDSSKTLVLLRERTKQNLTELLDSSPILPFAVKNTILLDITRALDYLHMHTPRITHRNLVSNNVLINDAMRAKVADLECSGFYSAVYQSSGTQRQVFRAPEVQGPNPKYEAASDMFSFGHIALHTAIHMFPGDLSAGNSEIEKRSNYITFLKGPSSVDGILYDLILDCLQDSPKKRPTANTALKELTQLDQKLECKGDKYHHFLKRMSKYEMAEKLIEGSQEFVDSPSSTDSTISFSDDQEYQARARLMTVSHMVQTGIPSVLYIKEMVRDGLKFRTKQPKWMEYKFKISLTKELQYSRLNDQVIDSVPLDNVVKVTAQANIEADIYPFLVHFRSGKNWALGAHNEDERQAWMEAILPGSSNNQFQKFDPPQPLLRSATAPALLPDPAYLQLHEINVPQRTPPPPLPPRPDLPPANGDDTYLPLLPPSPKEMDERVKAVKPYTLEQVNLMIQMFEREIGPEIRSSCDHSAKRSLSKPVEVSELCSKHPSKGLYVSFAEAMMANSSTDGGEERQHTWSPSRRNAVRRTNAGTKLSDIQESPNEVTESKTKLRSILRQQSSEDYLESEDDIIEWSKANVKDLTYKDISPTTTERNSSPQGIILLPNEVHDLSYTCEGHYGKVYTARILESQHVALKMYSEAQEGNTKQLADFIQEVSIIATLDHPNIAKYYAIVPENKWVLMEYAPVGDLKMFLVSNEVTINHLIKYMCDIAMGMQGLATRGIVHKNLALRNVLITIEGTCKVTDIGLKNRSFSVDGPQHRDQRRWMSPENLSRGQFSEASDVWSYGIVQWEMFQPARIPYSRLNNSSFSKQVINGHTLKSDVPDSCPEIVARIMTACWSMSPIKRPSFMYIASLLMKQTL